MSTNLSTFKIIPILGRKTDVSPDDNSMFQYVADGVYLTHDCGGVNFSLSRKRNACMKSNGYVKFSNTATSDEAECLGLFELYDGTNRDHLHANNGHLFYYDGSNDPVAIHTSDSTSFASDIALASDAIDLYSILKVGSYAVVADRAENEPQVWKHGDTLYAPLQGTSAYKFRYLAYFGRRIVGAYSTETNGNIDIRWSSPLPTPAATEFAAANQLWVPNDDPITGMKLMGTDSCFVYCEDSINQLVYYADYTSPFRIFTVVQGQGCTGHHSIIPYGNSHFLFNKNLGFCYYNGGGDLTPISSDIEPDIQDIDIDYYSMIQGCAIPMTKEIVWVVPMAGAETPSHLFFFNTDTKQWTIEDKPMRYVDTWNLYSSFTWNNLITALGGTGAKWEAAGTTSWGHYLSSRTRLVYSNTDGHVYYHSSDELDGSDFEGYRIEPIMDFGDRERIDILEEIWFDLIESGNFNIDVYWRGGNTSGEIQAASWERLGTVSHYSPEFPCLRGFAKTGKLHQIKWGTDLANERFAVNGITLKFSSQGSY